MTQAATTQSDLQAIKENLRLIGRTLANGYVDADTADEMAKLAYASLDALKQYEQTQAPLTVAVAA